MVKEIINDAMKKLWWVHSNEIKSNKDFFKEFEPRHMTDRTEVREALEEIYENTQKEIIEEIKKTCNVWSEYTGENKSIKLSILFRHLDELTLNKE